ncbi:MAG: hypothetical protein ACK4JX_07700 [Flavobacterium sp.]|jgi:hypothetical protein|nr:hypothetical protein [Flavobacteriales bacterium]
MKKRHEQKLVFISLVLLVIFNIPILLLFDGSECIAGLPKIYIFLFSVWALAIVAVTYILHKYHD